ncbi:hypothetical protein Tco_1431989, partial [Tanacetum coccineum]
ECPKNLGAGETKNLKKPSQTPRGVPVGPKENLWKKVYYLGDYDSDDEVASDDNEMASFLAKKDGCARFDNGVKQDDMYACYKQMLELESVQVKPELASSSEDPPIGTKRKRLMFNESENKPNL